MQRHSNPSLIFLIALALTGCASQPAPAFPTPTHPTALEGTATYSPSPIPSLTSTPTRIRTMTATFTSRPLPSSTPVRKTTRTPTFPPPPLKAVVKGMYGYGQLLSLSCESRSAADWARHFGITIHELDFLSRIPKSKNPEKGFVGSPNGGWGLIPPDAYGVHAGPVAAVLNEYGARARAVRNLPFDRLQAEIAAGRPVMVWVTGHVAPGKGVDYQIDGETITVARYEHTVIVIGYDEKQVTILDGKKVYQRTIDTFLQSWKALENMAILWDTQS